MGVVVERPVLGTVYELVYIYKKKTNTPYNALDRGVVWLHRSV